MVVRRKMTIDKSSIRKVINNKGMITRVASHTCDPLCLVRRLVLNAAPPFISVNATPFKRLARRLPGGKLPSRGP